MRHAALALVLVASAAQAQIVLKPTEGDAALLRPKTVDVRATVRDGVADSVWTYTFANDGRWKGQADFLIAIPKNGVVGGFAYWYQGEKVVARVAEKARAARIYAAIVRRQRDPALIELVGKSTFRVRIFPIEANADLRVELRMAQVLPAGPTGATLTLPLRVLGKLESATVRIDGATGLKTSWSQTDYRIANAKPDDLRVTEPWTPQPLHASFRAARSGGELGFFSLVLTPPRRLTTHRAKLTGPVQDVMELPSDDGSVHLVGRFRRGAPIRATLMGVDAQSRKYLGSTDLAPTDAVEPNGPAAKLWAWARIGRSKDRKEIVALSLRHTVPSRLTSWIAIPTEERERMAREIAQAEIQNDVARAMPRLRRVGFRSPEGLRTLAALEGRARSLGVELREGWSPVIQEEAERLGEAWVRLVERKGDHAPATLAAERELDGLRRLGGYYNLDDYYTPRARLLARRVVQDRMQGVHDPASVVRERELARLVRHTGTYGHSATAVRSFMQEGVNEVAPPLAMEAAQAQRAGRELPSALAKLRRIESLEEVTAEERVRQARIELAAEALRRLSEPVERALKTGEIDEAALGSAAAARRLEVARLRADRADAYVLNGRFSYYTQSLTWDGDRRQTTLADLDAAMARIERVAQAAGLDGALDWNEILRGTYWAYRSRRDDAQAAARRDRNEVATAEALLARVESKIDAKTIREYQGVGMGYNRTADLRNAYVKARHEGRSGRAELRRLVAEDSKPEHAFGGLDYEHRPPVDAPTRAQARAGVLQTLTELDRLDEQTADPEILARKQALEKRADELRARMGDPIVRVDAPRAVSVTARLPDGSWLALHRAVDGRWEGRFDVPPGARDGRYEIAVYADGEPLAGVPITVDSRAPRVSATWTDGRAVVETDPDVRRVAGFTPDGQRLELTYEAPGRFAALAPPGTRFVATDGAHNRSDSAWRESPDPRTPQAESETRWQPGVTALARVGGRLYVGTANDGGGFEGDAPDAARPWVKAAVEVAGRLAVRYADGTVLLDGTEVRRSRRSTAIAADGGTLLLGTIGGFYDGERAVFPPELAGVVVTALLGDGERVWLGTQGRGIAEVDRRSGALRWHDERAGLGDDWITALGRDARGRVEAGTFVAGAYVLDGAWRPAAGTEGTCVSALGERWIATRQGVFLDGLRVDSVEATALWIDGDAAYVGTRSGLRVLKAR